MSAAPISVSPGLDPLELETQEDEDEEEEEEEDEDFDYDEDEDEDEDEEEEPRKRIGTSLRCLVLAALLPTAAAAKKKPALDTYAIVSGSVFKTAVTRCPTPM